jgi:Tfp pilus assembly protein PilZ
LADPLDDPAAVPGVARSLHLVFEEAAAFLREYERNLVKGGAFVPTDQAFDARELVEVQVEAPFASAKLSLAAEVVHSAPGGAAVQFLDPAPELRARFAAVVERAEALRAESNAARATEELSAADPGDALAASDPLAGAELEDLAPEGFETTAHDGERDPNDRTFRDRADRAPTRVSVRVKGPTGKPLRARTRDLSKTGALLSVDGEELPVGRTVELELTHPGTGERLTVPGKVVRHLRGDGVVAAVAVAIEPGSRREALERFVDDVQRADEEARRTGIRGPLEELGAVSLLQMFAALARQGTLTVTSGVEEGVVSFADGQLVSAQVGSVGGVKALARIFGWREGFFEFRASVEAGARDGTTGPMEGAILEALRLLDEANRQAGPALAPGARFVVHRERLGTIDRPLETTEESVLELAAAGFTVRRILDVIPETDVAIRGAIATLVERGLLTPR